MKIGLDILQKIKFIKDHAWDYEKLFSFQRKLGITGEVGEILISYLFDLELLENDINKGFDAVDSNNNEVQIKAVRKRPTEEQTNFKSGRVSKFSEHIFDYCYLVAFDEFYNPIEIWKAEYEKLYPLLQKNKKRNPTVRQFEKVAEKVEIPEKKLSFWKLDSRKSSG